MSSSRSSSSTPTRSPTPSRSSTTTRKSTSSASKTSTPKTTPTIVRPSTTSTSSSISTDILPILAPSTLETFTSTPAPSNVSPTPEPSPQPVNTGLSGGAKAGIGIGAAIGVAILVVAAYFIGARRWKKNKGNHSVPTQTNGFPPPYGPTHPVDFKAPVQSYSPNPAFAVAHSPMANASYPHTQVANTPYPNSPHSTVVYPHSPNSAYTNSPSISTVFSNPGYNNTAYPNGAYAPTQPAPGVSELPVILTSGPNKKPGAPQHGVPQVAELSADQTPRSSRQATSSPIPNAATPGPTIPGRRIHRDMFLLYKIRSKRDITPGTTTCPS